MPRATPKHNPYNAKKYNKYYDEHCRENKDAYNAEWAKISRLKRRDDPMCEQCMAHGIHREAKEVHHIDSNPYNNAWSNLISLCRECHAKTRG